MKTYLPIPYILIVTVCATASFILTTIEGINKFVPGIPFVLIFIFFFIYEYITKKKYAWVNLVLAIATLILIYLFPVLFNVIYEK